MTTTSKQAPVWPGAPGMAPGSNQAPKRRGTASFVWPVVAVVALVLAMAAVFVGLYQAGRLSGFSVPGAGAVKPTQGCAPLPKDYSSGVRLYLAGAATPRPSGQAGSSAPAGPITGAPTGPTPTSVRVCGVGFHAHAAIALTLSAYPGAPYLAVSGVSITSDANGSFATTIVVAQTGQCAGPQSGARMRALDAQGAAATVSLAMAPKCVPIRA